MKADMLKDMEKAAEDDSPVIIARYATMEEIKKIYPDREAQ